MNSDEHEKWIDFTNVEKFEERYEKYTGFCRSYESWYLTKSQVFRNISIEGLFWTLSALILHTASKLDFFDMGNSLTPGAYWLLLVIPLLTISISIAFAVFDFTYKSKKSCIAFKSFSLLILLVPAFFHYSGVGFETVLLPFAGFGFGISIIAYLVNRLNGYTRAWSRYRTAGYQAEIINARYKSGHLSVNQANEKLFEIIELEVVSRHKDIISDLHFFGDKLNGLISRN